MNHGGPKRKKKYFQNPLFRSGLEQVLRTPLCVEKVEQNGAYIWLRPQTPNHVTRDVACVAHLKEPSLLKSHKRRDPSTHKFCSIPTVMAAFPIWMTYLRAGVYKETIFNQVLIYGVEKIHALFFGLLLVRGWTK